MSTSQADRALLAVPGFASEQEDDGADYEARREHGAPTARREHCNRQRRAGTAFHCDQRQLLAALRNFNRLWEVLFPAERARIVRLLVARVTAGPDGLAIDLRHQGLGDLARDLLAKNSEGVTA